jgi:hypothetical protein
VLPVAGGRNPSCRPGVAGSGGLAAAEGEMAKVKIPKRVAGWKVPKAVRKSALLKGLLGSKVGREIAAQALVAGASAAAAALVAEREEVADATRKGARKGGRMLARLTGAAESGAEAALSVVTDAARSMLPEGGKRKKRKAAAEAEVRH